MVSKENRKVMFDFLKGIACIGVIFIHGPFPGLAGQLIAKAASFAVPLFLMITGYFALGCDANVIKKRLRKTAIILGRALGVFFLYYLLTHVIDGDYVPWLVGLISIENLIKLVVFCTADFAVPLWYLIAMLETYVLWLWVVIKGKENACLKLTPALFLFHLVVIMVCDTQNSAWFWKVNVTRALSWFLLGYSIHKNERTILEKCKGTMWGAVAIAGGVVAMLPILFHSPFDFSYVGTMLLSIGIFLLGVKHSEKSICRIIEYIGKNLSLNIYIFHPLIVNMLYRGMRRMLKVDAGGTFLYRWARPAAAALIVILLAFLIDKMKTSKNDVSSRTADAEDASKGCCSDDSGKRAASNH